MNLVAAEARQLGAARLIGEYVPTKKNGMVRDHYQKLKFEIMESRDDGATVWGLGVLEYKPFDTFISLTRSTS
jgi:predicted enzyme involved in methoxymalonyl-ACP biosynthesis